MEITPIPETGRQFRMALMGSSQSKLWTIRGKAEIEEFDYDADGNRFKIRRAYFIIEASAGDREYLPLEDLPIYLK